MGLKHLVLKVKQQVLGVKQQMLELKKTSPINKAINVRKYSPMVMKEHKRSKRLAKTNRLTKSTEKY